MKKSNKIIHWISTGLLTAIMLMSAGMYFGNHEMVVGKFTVMGFPSYVIYPMAVAKLLGLTALWFIKSKTLKEWAYAGFTFNLLLAMLAHLSVNDGEQWGAIMAFIFLVTSYVTYKKLEAAE